MAIDEEITIKKLEVFIAFMRLKNLARVSEAIGQSTVSVHRALHSLEQGIGCPLFKQEGRNLIPLEVAFVLLEHAKKIIAECEDGIKKVRESAGIHAAQLKLGSLYSLTLRCIPQLVIGVKLRKIGLDVDLTQGSNSELLRKLEEGRLDAIVIGIDEKFSTKQFNTVPLFSDEMFLAVPADSPYAQLEHIDLKNLREEKFVTLSDGFITAQGFAAAFKCAGYAPRIAMQVGDIFSLINLVSGGIGYSLLPGRIASFSTNIKLVKLEKQYAPAQRITLVYAKHRERDANILALAAECRMYGRGHITD